MTTTRRSPLTWRRALLAVSCVLAPVVLSAEAWSHGHGFLEAAWHMIGHDIRGTRSQPDERTIDPRNVARLRPTWTFTTSGDVSATPAVVDEDDRQGRGHRRRAAYFPDWGGMLWKLDARTGDEIWSRHVSEYTGVADAVSRTSPAYGLGMVFIGDLNGNLMAIDAETGDLRWLTELDPNANTIVTASPVIFDGRLYIVTSSAGGGAARQIFRGSMIALDARTGHILWQTFTLPDNGGLPGGFAGGAFVNSPSIDRRHGLVIAAAGQRYTTPASVADCLAAAAEHWDETCFPPGAYFNSVVAFDLRTGEPRWSYRGFGPAARAAGCGDDPPSWCPPWEDNDSVWDFAGAGANVFDVRVGGRTRTVVGIGQKSGVYWALDAATGGLLWATLVGHGDDPGGIQWGTAVESGRVFAAIGHNRNPVPYTLLDGRTTTGGSWAALDAATGRMLWQTPDPQGASDLAALTVANGVVYAGSMAHDGDQMYALDARSGQILWNFKAGGSVVAGPAVVDGVVYWGSGYARTGGVGNDKFFAFSLKGK